MNPRCESPVSYSSVGSRNPCASGRLDRLGVSRVRVTEHTHAGVGREHALEPLRRVLGAVRDDDHAGVDRIADADSAAWCTLTHVAPAATLTSAFRIGQSAIASEPSRIASVSRYGDATEPASRWSRPITTGAFTTPRRTSSLMAWPAFARSP